MRFLKKLSAVLSSFGFAAILLCFLTLLTWLGTLEQVEHGLFETQKKYFDSLWLIHWFDTSSTLHFKIPLPLPGVYLLLALLLLNLLWGGIVRMRKDVARAGILVAHLGIVLMLVAGFVKYEFSIEGHMSVWPREMTLEQYQQLEPAATRLPANSKDEFVSYFDWDLSIREAVAQGRATEHLISDREWAGALEDGPVTFTLDTLPFDVVVRTWWKNTQPVSAALHPPMMQPADTSPTVDGFVLWRQKPNPTAEQNLPGLIATLRDKATGKLTDALFWGMERAGFTFESGGKTWLLQLLHKRWPLPFTIRLEKFTFETHPGTNRPAVFLSDVTKLEDGTEQKLKITMNEPLRHGGYTLFQAGYGPEGEAPAHYSDFAVVSNPSDQWPKYSCFVIAAGLLFHFAMKLMKYVRSENRLARPSGTPVEPQPAAAGAGRSSPEAPLATGRRTP